MHLQGYLISHAVSAEELLALRPAACTRMRELLASIQAVRGAADAPVSNADLQRLLATGVQRRR
jgi:hypothetical protein